MEKKEESSFGTQFCALVLVYAVLTAVATVLVCAIGWLDGGSFLGLLPKVSWWILALFVLLVAPLVTAMDNHELQSLRARNGELLQERSEANEFIKEFRSLCHVLDHLHELGEKYRVEMGNVRTFLANAAKEQVVAADVRDVMTQLQNLQADVRDAEDSIRYSHRLAVAAGYELPPVDEFLPAVRVEGANEPPGE